MGLQDSCIFIRRKVIEFSYLLKRDQESLYIVYRELRHHGKEVAGRTADQ